MICFFLFLLSFIPSFKAQSGLKTGEGAPLPKDIVPREQAQPQPAQRQMPNIDVFAPTNRPNEPVTAGLPFGPGINPQPQQQVLKAEEVKDFIYNSWLETGDDSLLEYI